MGGKDPAIDHRAEIVAVEQRMGRPRQRLLGRLDGFLQAGERQRLQRVELVLGQAKVLQHGIGKPRGAFAFGKAHAGATLHDRLVEEALGARHRQQCAHLPATAGLAEDRDVAGIASEAGGVIAHPLEGGHEIEKADVAGPGEALAADF